MAGLDPRKARTLLKLLREFSNDFEHMELEQGGIKVSVSKSGAVQTSQVQQPAKRQDKPKSKPESAIASLSRQPPAFAWES